MLLQMNVDDPVRTASFVEARDRHGYSWSFNEGELAFECTTAAGDLVERIPLRDCVNLDSMELADRVLELSGRDHYAAEGAER
jgi:hypothetical protein